MASDNPSSQKHETDLSQPGFSVELRAEKRVIVFTYHDLKRSTVDAWARYAREHDGRLRPPVRLLYDFRETGPPSLYMLEILRPLMEELTIHPDTRSAYLFPRGPYARFDKSLSRRMPPNSGEFKGFTEYETALQWLLK